MEKRFIVKNIDTDDYLKFLAFCAENFDTFYLYVRSDLGHLSKKGEAVITLLSPYLISKSNDKQFLSGEKLYDENMFLSVYRYKCNEASVIILSQVRNSFFSWRLGNSPEDLSFENNSNSSKLWSIAHESFAVLEASADIVKKFDTLFPDHSLTQEKYNQLPNEDSEISKEWKVDENGEYVYIGENDED